MLRVRVGLVLVLGRVDFEVGVGVTLNVTVMVKLLLGWSFYKS